MVTGAVVAAFGMMATALGFVGRRWGHYSVAMYNAVGLLFLFAACGGTASSWHVAQRRTHHSVPVCSCSGASGDFREEQRGEPMLRIWGVF